MLNGIEVRGLCRPAQHSDILVFKSFLGKFGGVFWVVILLALQTSQNFLIQKMLQKTLKICVIMPAFFDPGNGGKNYEICSKNFSSKNSSEKHRFP